MTDNTEYGVQDDGTFRRKYVDEIRDSSKRTFKNTAGEDIKFRPGSPQQAIINILAQEAAHQWMALEAVYYAGSFEDASGEALDKQLALAGFARRPARSATGEVVFRRNSPAPDDISIDEGTIVTTRRTETRPPIPFETTAEVILEAGETEVTAPIEARKPWESDLDEEWLGEETNVAAGEISRFGDPVSGVDEVENVLPTGDEEEGFQEGRDRESDAEFRLRYQNTFAEAGAATVPAIRASMFNADEGIESVDVEEIREEGVGYGVNVTVLAPEVDDDDIAQAVLESRGGGLESFGDEQGIALDDGDEKVERFDRATEVTIHVEAELTVGETFPEDGQSEITDRIIRYIGGTASDDISYPGLEIAEDVVYDQIFRRVMETRGVVMADVTIGVDPADLGEQNITVGEAEAAMTGIEEVVIDVA